MRSSEDFNYTKHTFADRRGTAGSRKDQWDDRHGASDSKDTFSAPIAKMLSQLAKFMHDEGISDLRD